MSVDTQAIEHSSDTTKATNTSISGSQANPANTRARKNTSEATQITEKMDPDATVTTEIPSQNRYYNGNEYPKAPLEKLPPKLLVAVLQHIPSPDDLWATVCASRTIYLAFRSSMLRVLVSVLKNAIHPAILPLALFICEHSGDDTIPTRRDGYLHKNYGDGEKVREEGETVEEVVRYAYFQQLLENVIKSVKPYPDELIRRKLSDLEIIVPLCRLYNLVDLMAYGYCSWTSRQVRSWAKPQDEDDGSFEHFRSFEISVSDLSRYEYARVQRAFFYFEIHRRFFADLEHDAECYWTAEEKQKGMKDCYNTHYNFMINRLLPQVELKIHGKPYFDDSSEAGIDSEVVDDNESTTNSYEASGENDIGICDEGTVSEDKADEDNAVGVGDKSVVDRDEADGDNEVEKNGESVNSSVKADSGKEDDDSSNSDLNSNYGEGDSDSDDSESDDNESNVEDNKVRFGSLLFRKSDIDATFKSASDWLSEGSLVKCCDSETCDHGIGDHDDPSLTQENCASLVHDSGLPYSYRAADFARRVSALKRIKITLLVEAGLPFCRLMFLGHRGYNIRLALILQYCISRKNRDPTYKAMFSADGTMVPDSDEGDEVAASTPAVSAAGGVSKGSDPLHPGALASSSSSSPSSSGAPPQSPSSPKPISEDDARQGTHLLSSDDIAERVAPVVRRYTGHYIWDASRLTGYRCELAGALVAFGWWRGINISVSDYKLGWHCLDAGVSPRALFILADALTETTRPYQPRLEEVMRQWDYLPLP